MRRSLILPCIAGLALACMATDDALAAGAASTPDDGGGGPDFVPSTSDARTVNNAMRHAYRVLSDEEKATMQAIKDKGLELHQLIEGVGASRELSIAKTKTEEAVMWAVKHVTA